jgi:hypothetical protein
MINFFKSSTNITLYKPFGTSALIAFLLQSSMASRFGGNP